MRLYAVCVFGFKSCMEQWMCWLGLWMGGWIVDGCLHAGIWLLCLLYMVDWKPSHTFQRIYKEHLIVNKYRVFTALAFVASSWSSMLPAALYLPRLKTGSFSLQTTVCLESEMPLYAAFGTCILKYDTNYNSSDKRHPTPHTVHLRLALCR